MARLLLAALATAVLLAGCTSAPPPASESAPVEPTGGSAGNGTAPNASAPPRTGGNATAPPASNTSAPAGPMVELAVSTAGQYPVNPSFAPAMLRAAPGSTIHLVFTHDEQVPLFGHDWVLEGVVGAETEVIAAGETAEVTFPAPAPGEYSYFCSVGDHRERGMVGTLTIG